MRHPAPLALAQAVAPLLAGLGWGIGGSTLLYRLGLEADPQDLDLVVQPTAFAGAEQRLLAMLDPLPRPPHPHNRTEHFARFVADDGTRLDLMAGIAVSTPAGVQGWTFDPGRVERDGALAWMHPEDWLELYRLFDRPYRVVQLEQWLSARDTRQRAEALEVRLAWLDDTLDSLSRTVARQQQEIDLLQEQLRVLYRQLQQGPDQSGSPLSLRDEVPPHY